MRSLSAAITMMGASALQASEKICARQVPFVAAAPGPLHSDAVCLNCRPVRQGAFREVQKLSPEDPTSITALLELLELAGRSMHSMGYADGLYPAQWTALRYFSKASDGSRTASALARFQGFANGPVSRTVRTLLSKGLLRKAPKQPAGRAEHLEITDDARQLLDRDPARVIGDAIAGRHRPTHLGHRESLRLGDIGPSSSGRRNRLRRTALRCGVDRPRDRRSGTTPDAGR